MSCRASLPERPYALAHANVHVWSEDRTQAQDRASQVASYLNAQGLTARVATLNNVMAPLGDMPGNVTREAMNIRRSRIELAAITRLAPVTGVSQGSREDWRFGGPALLLGTTRRGVPLYWSLNAPGSDAAHTALVGKTGAGKSALLAFMAMQFLRYPGAKVILFDRRRSFMVAVRRHGRGLDRARRRPAWRAAAPGCRPARRARLGAELGDQGLAPGRLEIRPHVEAAVTEALRHVAEEPPDRRTLTQLHTFLAGDEAARQTLRYYLKGQGPYGELFDGVVASYGEAAVVGVETRDVVQLEEAAPLAIAAGSGPCAATAWSATRPSSWSWTRPGACSSIRCSGARSRAGRARCASSRSSSCWPRRASPTSRRVRPR